MKNYKRYLYTTCLLLLSVSWGCGGCGDPPGNLNDLGVKQDTNVVDANDTNDPGLSFEACRNQCIAAKPAHNILIECKKECEEERQGLDLNICAEKCDAVLKQHNRFVKMECQSLCFQDDDRDGIPNSMDQCATSPGKDVNWVGCVDSDLDGVSDINDKCPDSKKDETINVEGCAFTPHCHEGDCSTLTPRCNSEEECDRQSERPLVKNIGADVRKKWILRELGKKASPVNCPGSKSAPSQPVLSRPIRGINPIETGKVQITLQNGRVVDGPKHQIDFKWNALKTACEPLTYAILIESYHCHHVAGLVEPATYYNRGWCRWEPVTYVSNIVDTEFSYDFEIGKHLFNIHKAFEVELNFSPPQNGPFEMSYQPSWLRTRVLSIDGNGLASASGMHGDHRYLVFYNPRFTRPIDLVNIPIAP